MSHDVFNESARGVLCSCGCNLPHIVISLPVSLSLVKRQRWTSQVLMGRVTLEPMRRQTPGIGEETTEAEEKTRPRRWKESYEMIIYFHSQPNDKYT